MITVQLGQCGNQMGVSYFSEMMKEHKISNIGMFYGNRVEELQRLPVMWNESSTGRFVPRTILCDLERHCLNGIRVSSMGDLFHPESYIFSTSSGGNNWAVGYMAEGERLIKSVMQYLRKYVEQCKSLAGFQIIHSTSGGTGGGSSSLLLEQLENFQPKATTFDVSLFPNINDSEIVVQPYNTMLTMGRLIQNSDQCLVLGNDAMYKILEEVGISATWEDINTLAALSLSGVTSSLRFPGKISMDIRSLLVNLTPFPRLHFYASSYAPILRSDPDENECEFDIPLIQLIRSAFKPENFMNKMGVFEGRFFGGALTFRGAHDWYDTTRETAKLQLRHMEKFVPWIPFNLKTSVIDIPQDGFEKTVSFMANSTAIGNFFESHMETFQVLYRKKAFFHWYRNVGMDMKMMDDAYRECEDLVEEYASHYNRSFTEE